MYFDQIRKNARKNRKDNGLFFSSLLIAIIVFYTLLSLGNQDIVRFLRSMEREALEKIFNLIPVIYGISLFFVFFLVYFAYKYQIDHRKREFGLYLMLGMRQSRLFLMLMGETLWNSLLSLLLGLPIALLLTESISLLTVKLVGIELLGHQVTLSVEAIVITVLGYLLIQVLSMLILVRQLSKKELSELLYADSAEKQASISRQKGLIYLVLGIILLLAAYVLGITMLMMLDLLIVLIIIVFGVAGTFFLCRGMSTLIGRTIVRKSDGKSGLYAFTGRQIQENVIFQYKAIAIASLLLLMSITCISFGIGITAGRIDDRKTADFTISGEAADVEKFFRDEETGEFIKVYYPMQTGMFQTSRDENDLPSDVVHPFSWSGLTDALNRLPASENRDRIAADLSLSDSPYIIQVSSYNSLLMSIGKDPIQLEENQAAYYNPFEFMPDKDLLLLALGDNAFVEIDGESYELLPDVYSDNIVSDNKITLSKALIVPDALYQELRQGEPEPLGWNVVLDEKFVEENGLTQALMIFQGKLAGAGLEYESYLTGIGRNLVYLVAGSYLTIYLGVLFMIIANTVIGLKYLIQQRSNKHRYLTLLLLGAETESLNQSARTQIRTFFGLVIGLSSISSIIAVISMFLSFMRLPEGASVEKVFLVAAVAFLIFIVIEFMYIFTVEHISCREIRALSVEGRRE